MSNIPERFFDTEVGKLFSHVLHEHNSAIGQMKNYNLFFENNRNNPTVLTEERVIAMIENNKKNAQKAFDSMDLLYNHFKDKFDEENK